MLKINEFFSPIEDQEWSEAAIKTLNLKTEAELERYTNIKSSDEISYRLNSKPKENFLRTFPTSTSFYREIISGETTAETKGMGVDGVLTASPIPTSKNQELLQVQNTLEVKPFGDKVLIDILRLIEKLDFDENKISVFLESSLSKDNFYLFINGAHLHRASSSITEEIAHCYYLLLKYKNFINEKEVYFLTSVDSRFFLNISKLRSIRLIWEKLFDQGALANTKLVLMANSSLREFTLFDSWNNMLRAVASASASFLGGADHILSSSYDSLDLYYAKQTASSLGTRQSRNIFHILRDESHLSRVLDSSRGSFLIEDLTTQLFDSSIKKLKTKKSLELREVFESLSEHCEKQSLIYEEKIRKRLKMICGINNFAAKDDKLPKHFNLDQLNSEKDQLFPLRRPTEIFETLRHRVQNNKNLMKEEVAILYFGDRKTLNARISFIQNYFEVIGLRSVVLDSQNQVNFKEKGIIAYVYCATDSDYPEMFELFPSKKDRIEFIAGNSHKVKGVEPLYMGQDIYNVLERFVSEVEKQ